MKMTTFSKNVKIFITKSEIENPKLGFESLDPSEHSKTISFSGKNLDEKSKTWIWPIFQ